MQTPSFPPVQTLVPHAGPMVFLSEVVHHEPNLTVCEVEIAKCTLVLDDAGEVAAWVGIEFMAQCIAAHAGLVGRESGEPPRVGLLVGARRVELHTERFHRTQRLRVSARHLWGRETGPVSFDGSVEDAGSGEVLVQARISCFVPDDASLAAGQR